MQTNQGAPLLPMSWYDIVEVRNSFVAAAAPSCPLFLVMIHRRLTWTGVVSLMPTLWHVNSAPWCLWLCFRGLNGSVRLLRLAYGLP